MTINGFWANVYGETGTLCYWNFCGKGEKYLDEDCIAYFEQQIEHREFMEDWEDYVSEYD